MREVVQVLRTMGSEQLFLALVFLASYSLAIGEFATARARVVAVSIAVFAAAGFPGFSNPWEAGVMLPGLAFVGIAPFSGAAGMLGSAALRREPRLAVQEAAANLPRAAAAASSRSRNTAPILNSPAAE